jgi:cytochrome P450
VADKASGELGNAVDAVLDRLDRASDGSVLSAMLHADGDDRMSRDEIVANTKLMLSGGLQEPRDLIALTIWALLTHHEALAEVRADRSLLKPAIEETLRCYAPVGTSTRQTTKDTTLAGVDLPKGALIGAVLASANRDPRRFSEPERFDLHRREGAHLAFATGNHFCLGAWLGRYQTRATLEAVLDRLPGLRLDEQSPVELRGWEFRAPLSLRARWTVA